MGDEIPTRNVVVNGVWGGEDLWHRAAAGDSAYRESYYFDFGDDRSEFAGFTSVGWKPVRGNLGSTTVVFDETGAWMTQARRATVGDFPLLEVEGLAYRRAADTLGCWNIDFGGSMAPTPELGTRARQPIKAEAPVDVRICALWRPRSPEVCTTGTDYDRAFTWHLDQAGDTEGHVEFGPDAKRRSFRGRGHRDRSFGARDWTHFGSWVYLAGHTSEVTINFWALQRPDGRWSTTGWVQHTGQPVEVVQSYRLRPGELLNAGNRHVPAFLEFELTGTSGLVTGTVESTRLVQLGFKTRHGVARLDRGLGSYVIDGHPGSGLVEYQQSVDGAFADTRWALGCV